MKRLILIILIFLAASSLKSQPVLYEPELKPMINTGDTLIINYPVKKFTVEKKSPSWQDFKTRITYLIPITTAMYIFRDDLQEWSVKNDKLAHLFLSYGISKFCGWRFAAGFMLAIELTQVDIFGISGRYEDTAADLFMDGIGITFSLIKF